MNKTAFQSCHQIVRQLIFIYLLTFFIFAAADTVKADTLFSVILDGSQEVPPSGSTATGQGSVILNQAETQITVTVNIFSLQGTQTAAHIHRGAFGVSGPITIGLPNGSFTQTYSVTPTEVADLKQSLFYVNIHSTSFPNGEMRGQISAVSIPEPANLVSWYRADGSNANDWKGLNNGTLVNGTLFATGQVGTAFSFDGINDQVLIPNSPSLNITGTQLTVMAWVKLSASFSGQNQILSMASATADNQRKFGLYVHPSGQLGFDISTVNGRFEGTFGNVPVETWTHVGGTYNGDKMRWYINGQQVGIVGISSNLTSTTGNLSIGQYAVQGFTPFKGLIDEPQIYNRTLTAAEIKAIYDAPNSGISATGNTFTQAIQNGKIAFLSQPSSYPQVFTINFDGAGQTNISSNLRSEDEPEWSFDGSKIVLSSRSSSSFDSAEIYVMNADGTNQIQLTNNAVLDSSPRLSPDGTKIVFESLRDGRSQIYTMSANGQNQMRITNNNGNDYDPRWSPDGSKIVYRGFRGDSGDIYVINPDGANQIRLTNNTVVDEYPVWSPDGTKVVFVSLRDGNEEIYLINADSSNLNRLTNNSTQDRLPAWSPDGSRIAFESNRTGNQEIFVMNATGNNQINLTNVSSYDGMPSWSPDGSKIAFYSQRTGNGDIYIINPDGSGINRLTNNIAVSYYPIWQRILGGSVTVSPAANLNVTFSNVTEVGNTTAFSMVPAQVPALPSGYTLTSNAYDIQTSATYSGNVTVRFNVPATADAAICSRLKSLHFENSAWTVNTNNAPVYNAGTQVCTVSQTAASLSPFVVALEAPTSFSYEADVQNRPSGDGFVDADDIQQIRNFSVAIGTPYQSNEFQRADNSPRSLSGDGFVDSDDVQQARRYSVGTDSSQIAGGPTSPPPIAPPVSNDKTYNVTGGTSPFCRLLDKGQAAPAAFRVDNQNTSAGQTLTVPIRVDTVGNEAGYTFSIAYDSTKLTNPQVAIGSGGGDVVFNADNPGQIGFSVTSFSGGTMAAANNVALINVTFTVAANASGETTPIVFTDTLARRKASGVDPNNSITQPTYTAGTITIGGATAAGASIGGRIVTQSGRGIRNIIITLTDSQGSTRTAISTSFGYFRFNDVPLGETYIIGARAKRYKFGEPTQVRNINGDIDNIIFVADEF